MSKLIYIIVAIALVLMSIMAVVAIVFGSNIAQGKTIYSVEYANGYKNSYRSAWFD